MKKIFSILFCFGFCIFQSTQAALFPLDLVKTTPYQCQYCGPDPDSGGSKKPSEWCNCYANALKEVCDHATHITACKSVSYVWSRIKDSTFEHACKEADRICTEKPKPTQPECVADMHFADKACHFG